MDQKSRSSAIYPRGVVELDNDLHLAVAESNHGGNEAIDFHYHIAGRALRYRKIVAAKIR